MAGKRIKKLSWFELIGIATKAVSALAEASVDGKVTVQEIVEIATDLATDLGYDVEEEGVELKK